MSEDTTSPERRDVSAGPTLNPAAGWLASEDRWARLNVNTKGLRVTNRDNA
ncbi:MAG TPA: hypothetical protein VGP31_15770 [Planosporangium sp.]|jgi:hypothetical protein|nr:hypothetical protein [Planosporangium sp.]